MEKIRLDEEAYMERGETCLITIRATKSVKLFREENFVEICATKLREVADKYKITVVIYCFMPDHFHLILNNTSGASIVDFVRDFKYKCTREAWDFGFEGAVFQKSFHDHFIRNEEELEPKITYIYENPIRKGLPEYRNRPPFVGSDVFEIE